MHLQQQRMITPLEALYTWTPMATAVAVAAGGGMVQKSASGCLERVQPPVEPKAPARVGARASPGRRCLMQLQSAFGGSLWNLTHKVDAGQMNQPSTGHVYIAVFSILLH